MNKLLDQINSPADLKKLTVPELAQLAKELREYVVSIISQTGGHLAPSLGVVELTLVLHYLFDSPQDKIVWDVGHQAYIHKILTGRRAQFPSIRQYGGISGFPKISESIHDHFGVGHASTSISAAIGIACARDLKKENYSVISVIGDGSLTGGLAFEGLNNAGSLNKDLIVVLNDNKMSISENVGALSKYLTTLITTHTYNRLKDDIWELTGRMTRWGQRIRNTFRRVDEGIKAIIVPGLLFERLGFRYIGPVDGHNLAELIRILREVKQMKGPILVHVCTVKGKGYRFAEENASKFHGLTSFDRATGVTNSVSQFPSYSKVFGDTLTALAEKNEKIVTITAAMSIGTGLNKFAEKFPTRLFDVGIAEGHAVTFAAGLATQGFRPVVAIYSSFLQRAYDQIIHDVALQKLPVIFALDRAGIVGDDGPTHHGVFDLSYLRFIPNLVLMAPKDGQEFRNMIYTSLAYSAGPVVIRYPRGQAEGFDETEPFALIPLGKSDLVFEGSSDQVAILALGKMIPPALEAAHKLEAINIGATVINARFVKPLDEKMLIHLAKRFNLMVTVEDNVIQGGFGSAVAEFYAAKQLHQFKLINLGLPDTFIEHGEPEILYHQLRLDSAGLFKTILDLLEMEPVMPQKSWEVKKVYAHVAIDSELI
ncbi:1-deoxy-D-xylulose-5-phosphate synthase [candidate division KSB1 bacterium]|nr:1-deoxy-D-xylulose-5-phosphate synthase [candidate division KSB1 bacterium]